MQTRDHARTCQQGPLPRIPGPPPGTRGHLDLSAPAATAARFRGCRPPAHRGRRATSAGARAGACWVGRGWGQARRRWRLQNWAGRLKRGRLSAKHGGFAARHAPTWQGPHLQRRPAVPRAGNVEGQSVVSLGKAGKEGENSDEARGAGLHACMESESRMVFTWSLRMQVAPAHQLPPASSPPPNHAREVSPPVCNRARQAYGPTPNTVLSPRDTLGFLCSHCGPQVSTAGADSACWRAGQPWREPRPGGRCH